MKPYRTTAVAAGDQKCWGGTVRQWVWGSPPPMKRISFNRFDFLYSGAFWGWPLLLTIHSQHPDFQGLDKLTLHIQTYFMAFPPAIAI